MGNNQIKPFHNCCFCGENHPNLHCPRVASITYNPDGSIAAIDLFPPELAYPLDFLTEETEETEEDET